MPDPIFKAAFDLARKLGAPTARPDWLSDRKFCAEVGDAFDKNKKLKDPEDYIPDDKLLRRLEEELAKWAADPASAPGIEPTEERMKLILRLWLGCLLTGKVIALETRDGPNSAESRAKAFEEIILPNFDCGVFRAGSLASKTWKERVRNQTVDLDGVPDEVKNLL